MFVIFLEIHAGTVDVHKRKARHDEDKGGRRKLKRRAMKKTRKQAHSLLLYVLASNKMKFSKQALNFSAEHHVLTCFPDCGLW